MFDSEETFLSELSNTLDQMIENARVLQECSDAECQEEKLFLQKAQESLLAKVMHTQEYLEFSRSKRQERHLQLLEKVQRLHNLSPYLLREFSKTLSKNPSLGKTPRIGRNRLKLKTSELAYLGL